MTSLTNYSNNKSIVLSRHSDYLTTLFDPSRGPASIPDDISVKHFLKTETVTEDVAVVGSDGTSATGAGIFVFLPNTPLGIIGAYYYFDQPSSKYLFSKYIMTAQELRDSYDYARHVAFEIDLIQNTISTTNFALSGVMNAIFYQGTLTELGIPLEQNPSTFYNSLLSNTANALDKIGNVRMSDGVSVLALPSSFDIPFTRLSDETPSSSNVGDAISADIVDNSQELIYNFNQPFSSPGSLSQYQMAMNVDQFVGPVVVDFTAFSTGAVNTTTMYAVQFIIKSPFNVVIDASTVEATSVFGSDLQVSTIFNLTQPVGSIAVNIVVNGDVNLARYKKVNVLFRAANGARPGINQPLALVAFTGANTASRITLSGNKAYELIPNPQMRRNIPTNYTHYDAHEMHYVKTLLSARDQLGIRSVMSIPMYRKFLNYYLELASVDKSAHAEAFGWGDLVRAIKKIAVPALSTLFPEFSPIIGGAGALTDLIVDKYAGKANAASGLPPGLAYSMNTLPINLGKVLGRDIPWDTVEADAVGNGRTMESIMTELYSNLESLKPFKHDPDIHPHFILPKRSCAKGAPGYIEHVNDQPIMCYSTPKSEPHYGQIITYDSMGRWVVTPYLEDTNAQAMNSSLNSQGVESFDMPDYDDDMCEIQAGSKPCLLPDKMGVMPMGRMLPTHVVNISELDHKMAVLFPTLISALNAPYRVAMYAVILGDHRHLLGDRAKKEAYYDAKTKQSIFGYTADKLPFRLLKTMTAIPINDFSCAHITVPLQAPYVSGESIHGAIYSLITISGISHDSRIGITNEEGVYGPVTGNLQKDNFGNWVLGSCPVYAQKKAYCASRGLNLVGSASVITPSQTMINKLINNKNALDCTIPVGLPVVELVYPTSRHEVAHAAMSMEDLGKMLGDFIVASNARFDKIESSSSGTHTRSRGVSFSAPELEDSSDEEEEEEVMPQIRPSRSMLRVQPNLSKQEDDLDVVMRSVRGALLRGCDTIQIKAALDAMNPRSKTRGPSVVQAQSTKADKILANISPQLKKLGVDREWVMANRYRGPSVEQIRYAQHNRMLPPTGMLDATQVGMSMAPAALPPGFPSDTPQFEVTDLAVAKLNQKWLNWLQSNVGLLQRYGRDFVDVAFEAVTDLGKMPDAMQLRAILEQAQALMMASGGLTPFVQENRHIMPLTAAATTIRNRLQNEAMQSIAGATYPALKKKKSTPTIASLTRRKFILDNDDAGDLM